MNSLNTTMQRAANENNAGSQILHKPATFSFALHSLCLNYSVFWGP